MYHRIELQLEPGVASSGDADGKTDVDYRGDGAEVLAGKDGKAAGVSYIDKATGGKKESARARWSWRRARANRRGCCSTPNRRSSRTGWQTRRGPRVGTSRIPWAAAAGGVFPQLEKMPPHNHDGTGGMHMYMPWWKFDRPNDFPRGYHIEFGGGREMPGVGMFDHLCHHEEGYGADLKAKARKAYGTAIGFAGRGEMIANPDTYCEIDPDKVDRWGIPVLRFHFKWSEYELRQARDMQETFRAIVEMAGGQYMTKTDIDGHPYGIPGRENHS